MQTIRYHLSGFFLPFQAEIGSFFPMNFTKCGVVPSRVLEISNTNIFRAAGVSLYQ